MAMQTSTDGQAAIKGREGIGSAPVLTAYQDGGGVWTIGFGTVHYPNGQPVKQGDTCTAVQAQTWFLMSLSTAEKAVNTLVKVPLTQPQFDALVSFVYNEGEGNFESSTLLQLLNQGRYRDAAAEFPVWNKIRINGVLTVSAGLVNRRAAEMAQFLSGTAPAAVSS
jgi:GH24 family phage-related lysozyme (muramidase)